MPLLGRRNNPNLRLVEEAAIDFDFEPTKDDKADEKTTKRKNPPRPKREFKGSDLVYRERLAKLKEENKHRSDIDILHALLDTVNALIPVAEENYQEYPFHTNAAAVNHLVSQQREILNDIRGLEDFTQRGEKITDFVAQQYRNVFQSLIADLLILQKTLIATPNKAEDLFKEFRNNQAVRFQDAKSRIEKHITLLLERK